MDPTPFSPRPELVGAPNWFLDAIASEPDAVFVKGPHGRLETRVWGPRDAPGVLLVHGSLAHARWWSFIAPFLARERRVVALSLSGMGQSDWRRGGAYDTDGFADDIVAVVRGARLLDGGAPPVLIAHSAGAGPAIAAASHLKDAIGGVIVLDSVFFQPDFVPVSNDAETSRENRIYPDVANAVARFRLAPPQPCMNTFIVDFIASTSLRAAQNGVTWSFDPAVWLRLTSLGVAGILETLDCRLAFINGALSALTGSAELDRLRPLVTSGTPFIEIPEAHHHIMIDQPLALVAALETQLQAWATEPVQR